MSGYPTFLSVAADIAAGMTEAEAIAKAARELRDAFDEEVFRQVMAEYPLPTPSTEDAP
jgi:formiminotetrahydrofolate cyclodeaminase